MTLVSYINFFYLHGVELSEFPALFHGLPRVLVSPGDRHGDLDDFEQVLGQRSARVGNEIQKDLYYASRVTSAISGLGGGRIEDHSWPSGRQEAEGVRTAYFIFQWKRNRETPVTSAIIGVRWERGGVLLHLDCPVLEAWREDALHQLLRHLVGVSVALLEDVCDGLRLVKESKGRPEEGGHEKYIYICRGGRRTVSQVKLF